MLALTWMILSLSAEAAATFALVAASASASCHTVWRVYLSKSAGRGEGGTP